MGYPWDDFTDKREFSPLGFLYEMGGTWVTHHMGYLFREMVRYKMDRHLITTGSPNMEKGYYTINVPGMCMATSLASMYILPPPPCAHFDNL